MKRILVPTDFSSIANNAIDYAIEIAADFGSQILLYHVYAFDRFNYDLNLPKEKQPYKREVTQKMKMTKRRFEEIAGKKGIELHTFVEEDSFYSLFKTTVIQQRVDMVVMGSKGASGLSKYIFGSVAASALEMTEVPLLIIPPGHRFRPPENMVLALGTQDVPARVLAPLRALALKYNAQITLLTVLKDSEKDAPFTSITIEGVKTNCCEIAMSHSVSDTITHYVQNENLDLLCMIRKKKGFFENFFKRSITKVQVFSSKVPMMVLPQA